MKKNINTLIILIAIGTVTLLGYRGFAWDNILRDFNTKQNVAADSIETRAWNVFKNYVNFAKAHDLEDLRTIAYQISPTCNDPAKVAECNSLMDNVYNIAGQMTQDILTHSLYDDHQIVLYTDGPLVTIVYFTRDDQDNIKVLGMRFCLENKKTASTCVDPAKFRLDADGNGWWDNVESLFYKT